MKIKTLLISFACIFAALFLVYIGYMIAMLDYLPEKIPLGYSDSVEPTWTATPATFVVWFLSMFLFFNAAFIAIRKKNILGISWALFVLNLLLLIIFHTMFQQFSLVKLFYITIKQGLLLATVIAIPSVAIGLYSRFRIH